MSTCCSKLCQVLSMLLLMQLSGIICIFIHFLPCRRSLWNASRTANQCIESFPELCNSFYRNLSKSIEIYRISSESSAKQLQTAFSLCLEMHAQWWIQRAKSTTSLARHIGTYFARHYDLRTPRLWDLWGSVKTIDAAMLQRDLFAKPKHQGWNTHV